MRAVELYRELKFDAPGDCRSMRHSLAKRLPARKKFLPNRERVPRERFEMDDKRAKMN